MSYSSEDYEADKRDEYLADQAWDDAQEEAYWNCKHEIWSITDAGIIDVESYKNGEKMEIPLAVIEVKCDSCGREAYGRVPYTEVLELLRKEFEHTGGLEIDEDGWGE